MLRVLIVIGAVIVATPVLAADLEPRQAFDASRMPGRWYEIARTPNAINRNCEAGTTDWMADGPGRFSILATCRKGSPTGPARTMAGKVRILDPSTNAKVRLSLFGGLISNDYWIVDRAADYGWLIMAAPNGRFVALFAARPDLEGPARTQALDRLKALGFDLSRLSFPRH